jgi:hypothetical protein
MDSTELVFRLKFPGKLIKRTVGFRFGFGAWLNAYINLDVEPDEFAKLPEEDTISRICYEAAVLYAAAHKKKVNFTVYDIKKGLGSLSLREYRQLVTALQNVHQPGWLKKMMPETNDGVKKK